MSKNFDYDNSFHIAKRIFKETIVPNLGKFILAIILSIGISALISGRAYLIKPVIDKIFITQNLLILKLVCFAIIAISISLAVLRYLKGYLLGATGGRIDMILKKKLFSAIVKSDMDFFMSKSSGKIMSHLSDVSGIMQMMNILLNSIITEVFTLAGLVILMFSQDWKLSIIAIFGFPLTVQPIKKLGTKIRKLSNTTQEQGAEFSSILNDSIESIKLVKSSNCEEFEIRKIEKILLSLYRLSLKIMKKGLIVAPMSELAGGIGFAGVIYYGSLQVLNGDATAGSFFTFITAVISAYKPAKAFSGLNTKIQTAMAAARRYYITIDREIEIKDKENAIELAALKGDIELRNVDFSYPYHPHNESFIELNPKKELCKDKALNGISLKIEAKKTTALVGHSGSGKSTIFNLILRFYDVQRGEVLFDNNNIKDVSIKSLRNNISVVSQDVRLFNVSVFENIKYGKANATKEEVIKAAQLANAEEFIEKLPQKYDTNIGQNGNLLSGGQRQRISIARAILQNKSILLLDEATSALDPISEKLIQSALKKLMKNRTTVIIAHRLSTIINADNIFVMETGKVIESGSHSDLINKGGLYSDLYNKQFE